MEDVAIFLQDIMHSFGFWGVANMIIITVICQLIKIPLKGLADAYADKKNIDKVIITRWFWFMPIVVSLVTTFVFYSWRSLGWNMEAFSWSTYLADVTTMGALSTSLYELIDSFRKAEIAKMASIIGEDPKKTSASDIVTKYRRSKKIEVEAKIMATAEQKAAKAKEERIKRISELQTQLDGLIKETVKDEVKESETRE